MASSLFIFMLNRIIKKLYTGFCADLPQKLLIKCAVENSFKQRGRKQRTWFTVSHSRSLMLFVGLICFFASSSVIHCMGSCWETEFPSRSCTCTGWNLPPGSCVTFVITFTCMHENCFKCLYFCFILHQDDENHTNVTSFSLTHLSIAVGSLTLNSLPHHRFT